MAIDCMESEMYYDQAESSENDKNVSKTMEAMKRTTTSRPDKTTSKTLLAEDILRQSGVSQKIIQRLPAYVVEQSINKLNEKLQEEFQNAEITEISMPLIQLTEPEKTEAGEVVDEEDDTEVVTVPLELLAEIDPIIEAETELAGTNGNSIEVPVTEGKIVAEILNNHGDNNSSKTVRKGFLFKADVHKKRT